MFKKKEQLCAIFFVTNNASDNRGGSEKWMKNGRLKAAKKKKCREKRGEAEHMVQGWVHALTSSVSCQRVWEFLPAYFFPPVAHVVAHDERDANQ